MQYIDPFFFNCESDKNYNEQKKDKHEDIKEDIKIFKKYEGGE